MEDIQINHYHLPSLLRLKDLDIRGLAHNKHQLRADEYLNLVSVFMKNMPLTIDTLSRIVNHEAASNDFWSVKNLKTSLEGIGCRKFSTDIKDAIKASEMGHHKFAAEIATRIIEGINELQAKISLTEKAKADDQEADDSGDKNDETQSLHTFLLKLEQEDAARKMRVLAIDDAPVILNTISSVLSEEYKVYGMTDPKMLIKFLEKIMPELFLLDYQMPDINGFDLVPIIRNFEEHKNTPIIFLTSFGTIDHVSTAYALGACDFIVKPFQGNILREKVAKHIVRKKLF